MDVWFDSGSSWAGVAKAREELRYPADLYLEGDISSRILLRENIWEECVRIDRPLINGWLWNKEYMSKRTSEASACH